MLTRDPLFESSPADSALELLRQIPAHRIGVAGDTALTLAAPIAKFRINANVIRPRAGLLESAYHWGWRFFVVAAEHLLPHAIDVRPGRNAGRWRAGLASGRQLAQQLLLIDRLGSDGASAGSLRFLDAPGLDWSGLWIVENDHQQLIPLARGGSINEARLMAKLRRTARRQQAAADARTHGRAILERKAIEGG